MMLNILKWVFTLCVCLSTSLCQADTIDYWKVKISGQILISGNANGFDGIPYAPINRKMEKKAIELSYFKDTYSNRLVKLVFTLNNLPYAQKQFPDTYPRKILKFRLSELHGAPLHHNDSLRIYYSEQDSERKFTTPHLIGGLVMSRDWDKNDTKDRLFWQCLLASFVVGACMLIYKRQKDKQNL